jgi:predicted RNA polymerase sigma factor
VPSLALAALDLEVALGRHQAALARLDRLLAEGPRNEAWLARRGELLERAGRRDEARGAYARALELIATRPAERRGKRIEELEHRLRTALAETRTPTEGNP